MYTYICVYLFICRIIIVLLAAQSKTR